MTRHSVGGNLFEMSSASYMVRGLGYLHTLADLENVPLASKNGAPVMIRDVATVAFGPDVRQVRLTGRARAKQSAASLSCVTV